MRLPLVNYHKYDDFRIFDPVRGELEPAGNCSSDNASGWFHNQDCGLYSLFRFDGKIHVYLDGIVATLGDNLRVQNSKQGEFRRFRAFADGELIFRKWYPAKPESDFNPFWPSDAEDEDFLLFIRNVSNSPQRQESILSEKST